MSHQQKIDLIEGRINQCKLELKRPRQAGKTFTGGMLQAYKDALRIFKGEY